MVNKVKNVSDLELEWPEPKVEPKEGDERIRALEAMLERFVEWENGYTQTGLQTLGAVKGLVRDAKALLVKYEPEKAVKS